MNLQKDKAAKVGADRQEGSISDLLSVMLCVLAMVTVIFSFLDCIEMINKKTAVSQIARNYILRMETKGYLTAEDEESLRNEMADLRITEVDLSGTTKRQVGYGVEIYLEIHGKINGEYAFEEYRVSTAKN